MLHQSRLRHNINRVAMIVLCGFVSLACSADLNIGQLAPEIHGQLLDGKPYSMASLASDDVLIVHFWATWCTQCRQEMPVLDAYYRKYRNRGLRVLAISMDDSQDVSAVKAAMQNYRFDAAMASDSSLTGYGRIWRIPLTFVIDRQRLLRVNGWAADKELDAATLESVVTPLLP